MPSPVFPLSLCCSRISAHPHSVEKIGGEIQFIEFARVGVSYSAICPHTVFRPGGTAARSSRQALVVKG
jgi:hypothetical protein